MINFSKNILNLSQILVRSALSLILTSVLAYTVAKINVHIFAAIPWFIVPNAAFCFGIWRHCESIARSSQEKKLKPSPREVFIIAVAIASLIALGVLLSGLSSIKQGRAVLAGDYLSAPAFFRLSFSFFMPTIAGIIEESILRGMMQFPLSKIIGNLGSQIVCLGAIVILHMAPIVNINQILLVTALAITTGVIAARTGSTVIPALIHGSVNCGIAAVAYFFRLAI